MLTGTPFETQPGTSTTRSSPCGTRLPVPPPHPSGRAGAADCRPGVSAPLVSAELTDLATTAATPSTGWFARLRSHMHQHARCPPHRTPRAASTVPGNSTARPEAVRHVLNSASRQRRPPRQHPPSRPWPPTPPGSSPPATAKTTTLRDIAARTTLTARRVAALAHHTTIDTRHKPRLPRDRRGAAHTEYLRPRPHSADLPPKRV